MEKKMNPMKSSKEDMAKKVSPDLIRTKTAKAKLLRKVYFMRE